MGKIIKLREDEYSPSINYRGIAAFIVFMLAITCFLWGTFAIMDRISTTMSQVTSTTEEQ